MGHPVSSVYTHGSSHQFSLYPWVIPSFQCIPMSHLIGSVYIHGSSHQFSLNTHGSSHHITLHVWPISSFQFTPLRQLCSSVYTHASSCQFGVHSGVSPLAQFMHGSSHLFSLHPKANLSVSVQFIPVGQPVNSAIIPMD